MKSRTKNGIYIYEITTLDDTQSWSKKSYDFIEMKTYGIFWNLQQLFNWPLCVVKNYL